MSKTISINAKCSDLFSATLVDGAGNHLGEYQGYVPDFLPNKQTQHYGDYVELKIDIDTGKILNWKKPTEKDLLIFKKEV